MKIAITGGAGFIGSHLADALVGQGHEVLVIDDLSSGKQENVNTRATLVKKDIREDLREELECIEAVFHLAAHPDVRSSANDPKTSFDINVAGTASLLESCRKADVGRVIFTSTSTVYGDAQKIPTPEEYPCAPISNYGASKLAGEAYLSSYSYSYGIKGTSLRLANIFGVRGSHGVMFDFYKKLKRDPGHLEILGDGHQDKSYLYVSDCISAILVAWRGQTAQYGAFNVGSKEKTTVNNIANEVCRIMGINPKFSYTGEPRGWKGDVRVMLLDISKLENLGWKQEVPFSEGVRRYIKSLSS